MITVEGKQYNTLREACDFYGLEESVVSDRLMIGWKTEIAFELVKPKEKQPLSSLVYGSTSNGRQPVEFKGVPYPTYGKLAKAVGVDYAKLKSRIAKGMPIEEAVFDIRMLEAIRKTGVVVEGVRYSTLRKACRDYNIDYDSARRLMMAGYTVEQVLLQKGVVVSG